MEPVKFFTANNIVNLSNLRSLQKNISLAGDEFKAIYLSKEHRQNETSGVLSKNTGVPGKERLQETFNSR